MDDGTGYWRGKDVQSGERDFFAVDRVVMTARLYVVLNDRKDERAISTYVAAALFGRFKTGNGFLLAMTCFRRTASGWRRQFPRTGGSLGRNLPGQGLACVNVVGKAFILKGVWGRKSWPTKSM